MLSAGGSRGARNEAAVVVPSRAEPGTAELPGDPTNHGRAGVKFPFLWLVEQRDVAAAWWCWQSTEPAAPPGAEPGVQVL